jgi:murein L,D-transpeptidase YafK
MRDLLVSRLAAPLRPLLVSLALVLVTVTAVASGAAPGGPAMDWERQNVKADLIVVHKATRVMELKRGDLVLRTYRVHLGKVPVGPKLMRGDGRTPEGTYWIQSRKENSSFHRALKISYPNDDDRVRSRAVGLDPGDFIMIHGTPNGYPPAKLPRDWTNGCIAVTNVEIEEIWRLVDDGTGVLILP